MARAPQQRAPQASGEDDFYDDEALYDEGADGTGSVGGEREDNDETAGAAEHSGQGDPELEEEGELGFEDEEPPQPRRGEGRLQRLANERNEYRRRLEELEAQTRQPPQQQGPRPETDQEFANRISLLSPEERMEARHERWMQQQTAQNQRTQFDIANQRDREEFRALCRADKRVARMADQVEREFEKNLRAGTPYARINILKGLAGQQWLDGDPGTRRAREAAARRVDRQTVKPASGGSDVRASRREKTDERTARARRLEGQQI